MKINLMEWGIVNSENYSGDIRDIPIKVFDEIYFTWEGRKVGKYSIYSKIRGKRKKDESEHFLDVLEGRKKEIVICVDGKEYMNPLSEEPKIMYLNNVESVSMINKYPPFVRIIEQDIEMEIEQQLHENEFIAKGIAIVCFPKEYKEDIHELSPNSLESLLYTMKLTIVYVKKFVEDATIYAFFNIGKSSGSTIKHIHSQIHFDNTPGIGIHAYTMAESFKKNVCNICKKKKYVLFEGKHFTCYLPNAMERNMHIRIKTNEHIECFENLGLPQIKELSYILSLISSSLDEYGIEEKNIIFRTKQPFFTNFHTFIDVLPSEKSDEVIGGGERCESMKVNSFSKDDEYKKISKYLKRFFDL